MRDYTRLYFSHAIKHSVFGVFNACTFSDEVYCIYVHV